MAGENQPKYRCFLALPYRKENKMARILVVDDEIENLNSLKRALGDLNPNWEIMTAVNEVKKWMEQWQLYVPDKIEIGLGCGIHTGEGTHKNVVRI